MTLEITSIRVSNTDGDLVFEGTWEKYIEWLKANWEYEKDVPKLEITPIFEKVK